LITARSRKAKAAAAGIAASVATPPVSAASTSTARRICAEEAPTARSRPKERRLSMAEATRALAMPRTATATAIASRAPVTANVRSKIRSAAARSSRFVEIESAQFPLAAARIRRRRSGTSTPGAARTATLVTRRSPKSSRYKARSITTVPLSFE
jgi:hypothetical protein